MRVPPPHDLRAAGPPTGSPCRSGFLKDRVGDRDELVAALVAVTNGGSVIDPIVVDAILARGRSNVSAIGSLTDRELEILAQMAQGKSNQAIVDSVHLSTSTVEKHVNMIFTKLGLDRSNTTINRRVAAVLSLVRDDSR